MMTVLDWAIYFLTIAYGLALHCWYLAHKHKKEISKKDEWSLEEEIKNSDRLIVEELIKLFMVIKLDVEKLKKKSLEDPEDIRDAILDLHKRLEQLENKFENQDFA